MKKGPTKEFQKEFIEGEIIEKDQKDKDEL